MRRIFPIIVCLTLCLVVSFVSIKYAYEQALKDFSAHSTFEVMANAYMYDYVLKNKGAEGLGDFLRKEIEFGVSTHRFAMSNQSYLSKVMGPEEFVRSSKEHHLSYYKRIQAHLKSHRSQRPTEDDDLTWLIENLD